MLRLAPRRLYFLHIPKTAGSSVTEWLTQQVGIAATCPAKTWDQLVEIPEAGIRNYRLFTGHFGWGFNEVIRRPLRVFTVFRDPLERTISHYRHVRRDINHPRNKSVASQTFSDFVLDVENWPMIENFQARYMIKNIVDPMQLVRRLDRDISKRNRLSIMSEDCRYLFDKGYVQEEAKRHFEDLDVVGVTNDIGSFLARVASRFHFINAPLIPSRANAAPVDGVDVTVDARSYDIVSALTEIDRELYNCARCRSSTSKSDK